MSCARFVAQSLLVSTFALTAAAASAATFTVTRFDDPAPGACDAGDCSLREAVLAANAAPVEPALHRIAMTQGTYLPTRGRLDIIDARVEFRGAGQGDTVISADSTEAVVRSLGVSSLYLQSLSIRADNTASISASVNGDTSLFDVGIEVGPGGGAGIVSNGVRSGSGNKRMRIRSSYVPAYVDCGAVDDCEVSDSTLLRLVVNGPADLFIDSALFDGTLNTGLDSGVNAGSSGAVLITDTEIRSTTNGILVGESPESFNIVRTRYIDNARPIRLDRNIDVVIEDSEFRGNRNDSVTEGPGALSVTAFSSTAIVRRSTFVGNTGNGPFGGAVLVSGGAALTIENSTFSNNSITSAAAQAGARGGAIGFEADLDDTTSLLLRHVTMVSPTIIPSGLSGTLIGGTGGEVGLALTILNSVLRGSCAFDGATTLDGNLGNIEGAGNTCSLDAATNQSNVATSALALGSLGNFGGRTPTYRPAPTSVAVDSANAANSLAIDQRGYRRPTGMAPDVGAVEQSDEIFRDHFE